MSKLQYVRDTLNAPRITRFGHEVVQVAHIEIGKHRAADIYRDVELPDEGRVAYLLERQGYELHAFKPLGEYRIVGYLREER